VKTSLSCLLAAAALFGLGPALGETAPASSGSPGDAGFMQLADEYIDQFYLPENPTQATALGVHRFDGRLENYGRAAVTDQVRRLKDWERRLVAIDAATLSERVAGDRELLLSNVRSTLLTLQSIRPWQNNPDIYPSGIAQSAFVLMERSFAPPADRLLRLVERERAMPVALMQAHQSLENPPEIFTRIALEQLPGTIDFFEHDVPEAFADVKQPALQAQLRRSNAAVIGALRHYQDWLTRQVLPRSHGDFRIGARTFGAKLLYDEMVDTPLDRLLEIGTADLRRNQQAFVSVAHELEPGMSTSDAVTVLDRDHPTPDQLLPSFRATFDSLIAFIGTHHIITVPDGPKPILEDTPPFERATTMASMDTPGPFERGATEAYFNVTPPEANWDAHRVAGFMAGYSYPVISNTAVHEAYPGHYVQYLWIQHLDDRVRQIFGAATNYEGWAHYCEQMMLDEGFGQAGPGASADALRRSRLLRLGQLRDALLRDARFVVGIRMHTGSMSLPEAIDFFHDEGYQTREVGELEAKRGASDPTYLYYTLGKLQILKLRTDVAAREGAQFDLQRFHDDFMRQGQAPIKLVRRALLHDDSPTL
jgi:uncharacterized protein (DUF885 family)